MSEGRSWGSTVLGWFIVRDQVAAAPDAVAAQPDGLTSPAAPASPLPSEVFQAAPPSSPGGQVDFDGVFDAAGIDRTERERVVKAAELLGSLPSETPVAVRKQIVEAALKAFGVPIEKIIETGVQEIEALEGYIRAGGVEMQTLLEESKQRIEQYESEISNIRTIMDQRVQEQQSITTSCNSKKLEVQRVLEFFGQEAVARVVRDSPKLHEPSPPPEAPGQ
jgi:hypothetical protein